MARERIAVEGLQETPEDQEHRKATARPVDIAAFGIRPENYDDVIADAEASLGLSFVERYTTFAGIQRLVAATWEGLSEEEIRRRLAIGEALDPRPEPWWRDVLPEGLS